MFFGVVGTIMNFLVIALGAMIYTRLSGNAALELSWNQSLLFASVLAGSDEVSAMSLIRIKDFPRMGALIFGEGVINDALSIVLFKTFLPLYNAEMGLAAVSNNSSAASAFGSSYLVIMSSIVFQIVSSCAIGMACGLVNALFMKSFPFAKKFPISQTALVLLFGYLSYTVGEAVGVSGILTLFVAAITLAHYSWYSLSNAAKIATRISFAGMSDIAEGFAFSYVGLSLWGFDLMTEFDFQFAAYMLAVVVFARVFTVLGLFCLCQRFFQSFDIPLSEKIGFTLGGVVRGCLCWAQILQVKGFPVLVTSTLIIVMTTLLAGGVLLPMVIPKLGVKPFSKTAKLGPASTDGGGDPNATAFYNCENGLSPETTQDDMHLTHLQQQSGYMQHTQYVNRSMLGMSVLGSSQYQPLDVDMRSVQELTMGESPAAELDGPPVTLSSLIYIQWIRLDERFLKPLFGGSATDPRRGQLLQETNDVTLYSLGRRTPTTPTTGRSRNFVPHFGSATKGTSTSDMSPLRDADFAAEGEEEDGIDFAQQSCGLPPGDSAEDEEGSFLGDVTQLSEELNRLADRQVEGGLDGENLILDNDCSIIYSLSSPLRSSPQRQERRMGQKQLRFEDRAFASSRNNNSTNLSPIAANGTSSFLSLTVDTTPQKPHRAFPSVAGLFGSSEISNIKARRPEGYGATE